MQAQLIIAFTFGVTFVVVLIVLAIRFPHPTAFQYTVFRTILALAAAGAAAMIPGFIHVELNVAQALLLRAGGALAVFAVVFFYNPATLLIQPDQGAAPAQMPLVPRTLPNGRRFPEGQERAFGTVWEALVMLDMAGADLWQNVTRNTLSNFADRYRSASEIVGKHGLFFSEEDYSALQEVLRAANLYLGGKAQLSEIRSGYVLSDRIVDLSDKSPDMKNIKDQIRQNKRWLTRYRNLLNDIRSRLNYR